MFENVGKIFTRILAAAIFVVVVAVASVTADAQHRTVIVNGQLLSLQGLYVIDRLNRGYVPDGNYWLNMQTGIWGYAGDPRPRGRIGGGVAGGGGSGQYPSNPGNRGGQYPIVIDPSGGCEGGSCVNILD